MISARRLILVVLLLGSSVAVAGLHAQTRPDSSALEQIIANTRPELTFEESARVLLLQRLTGGDGEGARELLTFMDGRRSARAPWLTPAERLFAEVLAADPAPIREGARLRSLLAGAATGARVHAVYDDRLLAREVELLRSQRATTLRRYDETGPSEEERRFHLLLVNHLTVRGWRSRSELNDQVAAYAAAYPGTPFTMLAQEYIAQEYREETFGASFSAGYAVGAFDGSLGEVFDSFYGPALAGELYFDQLTIAGDLQVGIASAAESFTAGATEWRAGRSSFISMSLDAGWEFRFGMFAVTPLVGLAVQSARAPEEDGDSVETARTRNRIGWDIGAIAGYRIPFDRGPSLDLRVRIGRSQTLLSDYDPRFSGGLWYAQFSFAIVQRPAVGGVQF